VIHLGAVANPLPGGLHRGQTGGQTSDLTGG